MNIFRKTEEVRILIEEQKKNAIAGNYGASYDASYAYDFITLYSKLGIWARSGARTFRLSKELIDAFVLTDVSLDVMPSDFNYPFNTFLIEGEKPLYRANSHNGKMIDVHSILFVHKSAVIGNGTHIVSRGGHCVKSVGWDISISGLSPGANGFGLDNMWINMRGDQTIMDSCNVKNNLKNRDIVTIPEAQSFINIFFNTVIYINDPTRVGGDTEQKGHSKYKIGRGKETVKNEYIVLRPPKHYIPIPGARTGRTIDKRFIVRGHYRMQVCGKKRAERRRVWILPFWKGPELSEIVSKKYKVI